ncbi:hypothetical protein G6011_11062 [Alternaria panax]|uniref:Letm1 RBD domain-containing protein n=1 Tax=Alternaria panax TaxID=48097 RepID=A0AAD4ID53_9PLEO|nr:hypothetical protein G6011_11062 [Alternaria panax]
MPSPPTNSRTNIPTKTTSSPSTRIRQSSPLAPAQTATSRAPSVPTLRAKEKLNPPPFTYAPEISVPARKPDQNFVKWLYQAGRAYLTFYKTGISHVRQTSKLAKTLRQKAAQIPNRDISEVLTRAEWQIVRRSKADTLRLPAFGLLVLLLGEWLPIVVMYITPVIPEACRIPQQVQRAIRKLEDKRQDRLRRVALDAMRLMRRDRPSIGTASSDAPSVSLSTGGQATPVTTKKWNEMTLYEFSLTAAQLDCYPAIFDWLPVTAPKFLLQRNVRKKLEYLQTDDKLIKRDGGWSGLGREELQRVCVDRGLPVLGKREDELRKALAKLEG